MSFDSYLFGTPEPAELDDRACYSRDSTAEVERLLVEGMTREVAEYTVPHVERIGTGPLDRWRLASCLQKSIRFCMPDMALTAMNGLYAVNATYAIRRFGVIAVEDVMAGDPLLVARVLAMLGQKEWRREVGELRLLMWLVKAAAEAPKDRSAVELLVRVDEDQSLDIRSLVEMTDDGLAEVVTDPHRSSGERTAATQVLAGPAFASDRVPKNGGRTPTALFRLMVEMGMTRWGLYVAAKTASRLRDTMFVSMPQVDGWLRGGSYTVVDGPAIPHTMVGDVLGAAYDKYTRPGLVSIARFAREVPDIRALVFAVNPDRRRYATGVGVFLAEGGVLARRVVYGAESEAVHLWARSPERLHWLPPEMAAEYVETVRRNLDRLNEIREEVVCSGSR